MSEQLYNVVVHYGYVEPQVAGNAIANASAAMVEVSNTFAAYITRHQASMWLLTQNRQSHLVNVYDNGADGLLFKFNDRDTALLFKLSR